MWTVEWLDHQNTRLLTETSSTMSLGSAQPFASRGQGKQKKRKLDVEKLISTTLDCKVAEQEHELSAPVGSPSEPRSVEAHSRDEFGDEASSVSVGDGQYHYYLLKPRTSSSRRVLIPLNSNATLGECLQGRTVLEFPTIYAFPSVIQQLPEEFILEEDYQRQEGEEQKEFDDLIRDLDPEILRRLRDDGAHNGARSAKEEVDSKAILDVLKKDIDTGL
jgi:hypothetical protein